MVTPATAKVFISYRRDDTGPYALLLYDRLTLHFGEDQVFMDLDNIAVGDDFAEVIDQHVSQCAILLAVIGKDWLTVTDADGRPRLADPNDYVRLEIETALARKIPVIPVLVGTSMPHRAGLPEALAPLTRRHALIMRLETFRADAARLIAEVDRLLADGKPAQQTTPAPRRTATPTPTAVQLPELVLLDTPQLLHTLHHDDQVYGVEGVEWSPDGRWLATVSGSTARVWDAANGHERLRLTPKPDSLATDVGWSPDGRWLATITFGGSDSVRIWDAANGHERLRLQLDDYPGSGVEWSPDGRWLATANGDARIWDAANGDERLRLHDDEHPVKDVGWSPDGRWLATTSYDGIAWVWDAANGDERLRLHHDDRVYEVEWSPDGRWLATITFGDSGSVRIWDAANGDERLRFTGRMLQDVGWSPDGRWLATGSNDRTARIWDAANGDERLRVHHSRGGVQDVGWSPDGRWLATGSNDRTARIWEVGHRQT